MSILLESLKRSKQFERHSDLPDIGDSHYDDEMLSDEWLLKKLVFWKRTSGFLVAVVLLSWSCFFYYSNELKVDGYFTGSVAQSRNSENAQLNNRLNSGRIEPQITQLGAEKSNQSTKKIIHSKVVKEEYKPIKIKTISEVKASNLSHQSTATNNKALGPLPQNNQETVNFESLSPAEQQQLPDLEISSYAVSSNPKKSFIVLNTAFYAEGETVAPGVVLISIDKEGFIVSFNGRNIRKKYSL